LAGRGDRLVVPAQWAGHNFISWRAARGMGTIQLEAGDILPLPHGDGHIVRSRIGGALGPVKTDFCNAIRANSSVGVEADTELVCGRLSFETGEDNSLAAALPEAIIIRTLADRHGADPRCCELWRKLVVA
jgi:Cupin